MMSRTTSKFSFKKNQSATQLMSKTGMGFNKGAKNQKSTGDSKMNQSGGFAFKKGGPSGGNKTTNAWFTKKEQDDEEKSHTGSLTATFEDEANSRVQSGMSKSHQKSQQQNENY